MSSRRKLPLLSVWDVPALLKAFEEAGVKAHVRHAQRLWG